MKVGILTLPFNGNYGGILQTYGLQKYLQKHGYEVIHIYRDFPEKNRVSMILKDGIKFLLGRTFRKRIKRHYTFGFFRKYVTPRTKRIRTLSDFKSLDKHGITTIIVGSDQVWRRACIYGDLKMNYFLDFAGVDINRMTYAASFGVDFWEFDKEETKTIKGLIHKFSAVSVREESGLELCKEYLGVHATHVIDPVMLLSAEDYISLIEEEKERPGNGDCLVYLLDLTEEKQAIVSDIANKFDYNTYSVNDDIVKWGMHTKPSVTSWLRGFYDSKFVITDSFHGCLFSIIFNKPFLVIGNKKRGLARFVSVLSDFDLERRMILGKNEDYIERVKEPIDWDNTNRKLEKRRQEAHRFLISSIK